MFSRVDCRSQRNIDPLQTRRNACKPSIHRITSSIEQEIPLARLGLVHGFWNIPITKHGRQPSNQAFCGCLPIQVPGSQCWPPFWSISLEARHRNLAFPIPFVTSSSRTTTTTKGVPSLDFAQSSISYSLPSLISSVTLRPISVAWEKSLKTIL